jgi:epoxyqueuosine reductase
MQEVHVAGRDEQTDDAAPPGDTGDTGAARKAALRARALAEGFAEMGVCRPDAVPEVAPRLRAFVAEGYHGQMGWLAERMEWRGDPAALWPEARSVVMLAEPYTPREDPLAVLGRPDRGAVSVYARGKDYHDLVKKRLKRVARWLAAETGAEVKVFVDTAPVPEKALGQAAGLGWQGKHTNLLGRSLGNWFFLGCIFTTAALPADAPEREHCGSCRACLDVCPTDAFPAPWRLDARRCISYLTIEHRGPVDEALRPGLGNRIYGCDDCLAVCPWNKFAAEAREMRYAAREGLSAPRLADLARLDDAGFRAMFAGSPIKRIGRDRFVRNVLYAIGNSGDPALAAAARPLADDPDAAVADAARWAVARLAGPDHRPAHGPEHGPGSGSEPATGGGRFGAGGESASVPAQPQEVAMRKHILDHPNKLRSDAPVTRYASAARRLSDETTDKKILGLRRRAKGPFNPAARMRAFLRIDRGYDA